MVVRPGRQRNDSLLLLHVNKPARAPAAAHRQIHRSCLLPGCTALAASPPIPAPTISTWYTSSPWRGASNGHDASRSLSGRQDEAEAAPEKAREGRSNRLLVFDSSKLGFSERALISCVVPRPWHTELNARTTLAWTGGG